MNVRILIIDDDARHGESLVELLSSRGYEAYFAPTPEDAEWLLGLFRFDLTVIDFDMPSASGPEVARKLLVRLPGLEVAIISAHEADGARRELIADLPFFPKPIEAEAFVAFVERVSAQRRGLPLMRWGPYPLERYRR